MIQQKPVLVDLDVYTWTLRQTQDFGESFSQVLRRLLKIPVSEASDSSDESNPLDISDELREKARLTYEQVKELLTQTAAQPGANLKVIPKQREYTPPAAIVSFVRSPEFQSHHKILDRYLALLSWLQSQHPDRFEAIENLRFGGRKYFARSASEITESGSGVTAKHIPETAFYALGTLSNTTKKSIVARLLSFFGYMNDTVNEVLREFPESEPRFLTP